MSIYDQIMPPTPLDRAVDAAIAAENERQAQLPPLELPSADVIMRNTPRIGSTLTWIGHDDRVHEGTISSFGLKGWSLTDGTTVAYERELEA